jgi:Ala-tRNA(Pro) deacylase
VARHSADLKSLPDKSKRLSLGNADLLMEALGRPGSVTALALINDEARRVQLVLDREMMERS